MRVIDEKGRIFGKINVIDFLAILFLLYIIPIIYLGYKNFNKPAIDADKRTGIFTTVDVAIIFKDLEPQVAELISMGDKELDSRNIAVGEIIDVIRVEPNFINIRLSDTDIITKEDSPRRQVMARMRFTGRLDGSEIVYKENKIKIGSEIIFQTGKYTVKGIIISETIQDEQVFKPGFSPITIDILFKNLSPEVVSLISVGDFETDNDGDTIVKVLNIGQAEPYTYSVDLGGGNYITKTDPQKKQVQAKIEIMGVVEGGAFYFRRKRIALDSEIEFNTNKYKIEGVIIRDPLVVKKIDKKWLLLRVRFTDLIPELAEIIKKGDEQIDKTSGDLIAKVIKVESINSIKSSKITIQDNRQLIIRNEPLNKDITLLMKASCIKTQRDLLFKETLVKIGGIISLQTNKYDIAGTIVGIQEIND